MPPNAKGGASAASAQAGGGHPSSDLAQIATSFLPVPAADVSFSEWTAENISIAITNLISDFNDFISIMARSSLSSHFFLVSTASRARAALNRMANGPTDEQKTSSSTLSATKSSLKQTVTTVSTRTSAASG